ncbi:acyl carrier protein [Maritimibacter alkaliphilus HTCC2654]|uniref:Acyl carrier protein n=1 Tax=Maritimibacter alkaliphilus HTCC2654 TaxID=314271 RepID=A3VAJ5_9RHOB|nr:acyl carrier protein [Maritimibacter alkaliphilus HTCC2654]
MILIVVKALGLQLFARQQRQLCLTQVLELMREKRFSFDGFTSRTSG